MMCLFMHDCCCRVLIQGGPHVNAWIWNSPRRQACHGTMCTNLIYLLLTQNPGDLYHFPLTQTQVTKLPLQKGVL